MKYQNILIVGGSGFVGRHLVAALAARGASVTVPTRRRERAKHLIMLPTVDVVEADLRDAAALAGLAAGRDAVVNLAGILHGPDFKLAHVELAQAVVNACHQAGVKRLLHMSALGADPGGAVRVPALQGHRRARGARGRRPGGDRVPARR